MEPKTSYPESGPSQTPRSPEYPAPDEHSVEAPQFTPEQIPERAAEQQPAAPAAPVQDPASIALPTPVPVQPATDDTAASDDGSSPAAAADEDLIEKEWVDKAKQIIAATKDDPHEREKEVGKLQADYLKKRYGKELGKS